MPRQFDMDAVYNEGRKNIDHIIVCYYGDNLYDRHASNGLINAKKYMKIKYIINLNVWPKHKKGIII